MTTAIEWTDATWNPIRGCSRVSEGCRHCYAERVAARFSGPGQPYEGLANMTKVGPQWTGKIRLVPEKLEQPLHWRKPRMVFVNSMADLFHEDVPEDFIDQVFAVMALTPRHTYQVLTKRPERMRDYMRGRDWSDAANEVHDRLIRRLDSPLFLQGEVVPPLLNIWLGVSSEDQATADERTPLLLETPAAVRWVSAEPLLGPIDFWGIPTDWPESSLRWVVVGGESGPGYRPMKIEWLESIVDECKQTNVPVFVKQDSGPRPGKQGRIPDDLWIKEYPL